MSTLSWRRRFAEAAGVTEPHESERWPLWMTLAARTITQDPRELMTLEKEGALLRLLEFLRDAGPAAQDALVAAGALGGDAACIGFVHALLRERVVRAHRGEAQGELAGGSSAPEKET